MEDKPNVANTVDAATQLPIYSLHAGPQHRLTPEMLKGVDTLVYDIQDVGARFYNYSCTMIYSLQEAARAHLPFYVLDRPNPITGAHVEGLLVDPDLESYVGCAAIPIRHGFTFGELAQLVNSETHLGADLHVIQMEGWRRSEWWDDKRQRRQDCRRASELRLVVRTRQDRSIRLVQKCAQPHCRPSHPTARRTAAPSLATSFPVI